MRPHTSAYGDGIVRRRLTEMTRTVMVFNGGVHPEGTPPMLLGVPEDPRTW